MKVSSMSSAYQAPHEIMHKMLNAYPQFARFSELIMNQLKVFTAQKKTLGGETTHVLKK
jgi:hypothetical protein